jgi:predicted phosphate transport protein (TIGR00153 family)
MRADSIIKWLMPKEDRFQTLLSQDTRNLVRAARVFAGIAESTSLEDRRVKVVELKAREHEGDDATRRIFEALNSSFITPLDREDIRSLANDIDNILDYLEGVAQHLVLFELGDSPEGLRQFAAILVRLSEEVDRAMSQVWDLKDPSVIQASIVMISELENQADVLYATVIADLFKRLCHDSVEIMKWKEVYDGLEEACDACKDFSHVLGNVVIKNA